MAELRIDWAKYEADFERGALGLDAYLDLETGRIEDAFALESEGEAPRSRPERFARTFEGVRWVYDPAGSDAPDVFVASELAERRAHFLVFTRYERRIRERLEETYNATRLVDWTSVEDRREKRRARAAAFEQALLAAPGAKEAIARDEDMRRRSDLLAWLERLPVRVSRPPWEDAALAWREARDRAFRAYTRSLLERLDVWLRENARPLHARLRPGLGASDLDAAERRLGHPLPGGLRALYGWRDGTDDREGLPGEALYAGSVFAPLRSAERDREMLDGLFREGHFADRSPIWWQPGWLPIFDRGNGDAHCVDLGGTFGRPGSLLEFRHDDPVRIVPFLDVEAWLEAYVPAIEAGMFCFDGHEIAPPEHDYAPFWAFHELRTGARLRYGDPAG